MQTSIMGIPLKDIVYHGTVKRFTRIELKRGKEYKDFGKGFYTAYSKMHSVKIVHKGMKIYHCNSGVVYSYETQKDIFEKLVRSGRVKFFPEADEEWIDFVIKSRSTRGVWHNYDIVVGPTADDDMKLCFDAYHEGLYGKVGSRAAKDTLIRNLEVENVGVQMYFATPDGIAVLNEETRTEDVIIQ